MGIAIVVKLLKFGCVWVEDFTSVGGNVPTGHANPPGDLGRSAGFPLTASSKTVTARQTATFKLSVAPASLAFSSAITFLQFGTAIARSMFIQPFVRDAGKYHSPFNSDHHYHRARGESPQMQNV